MKYSATIICAIAGALTPITIDADDDNAAVDAARAKHTPPDEGGDYTVEVKCLEAAPVLVLNAAQDKYIPGTRSAGVVVSSFEMTHPPAAHVAKEVYAARAEAEEKALLEAKLEELRAAERAKVFAELGLPDPLLVKKEEASK